MDGERLGLSSGLPDGLVEGDLVGETVGLVLGDFGIITQDVVWSQACNQTCFGKHQKLKNLTRDGDRLGLLVGLLLGLIEGGTVGDTDGLLVGGLLGDFDELIQLLGPQIDKIMGKRTFSNRNSHHLTVDGDRLGLVVGLPVGLIEGEAVGTTEGLPVGEVLGDFSKVINKI